MRALMAGGALVSMLLVLSSAIYAHHSIASIYDEEHQIVLQGVVSRFTYVNPHPVLMMDVKDPAGHSQVWRLEMDNRAELAEAGFDAATLKAGDLLTVTGSPARTIPHSLYVRKLERPADGFVYEHPPY
jgi:hypothetical protein